MPHIKGEPYTVEQVREAAEHVFEGSDPHFKIVGQVPRLQKLTKAPQLFSTTDKAAEQRRTDQPLQGMPMLVVEEVVHQSPAHPVKLPVDHLSTTASAPAPSHNEVHQPDDQHHQPDNQHHQPAPSASH